MCGLVRPIFRLPYVPLSREQREHGAKLLRAVQQHIPGCKVGTALQCVPLAWLDVSGVVTCASPLPVQEVRVMDDDEFILIHSAGQLGGVQRGFFSWMCSLCASTLFSTALPVNTHQLAGY